MKHLLDYINEAVKINEGIESKTITFDFTDLENGEETIKSLDGQTGISVDGLKVTLSITKDNVDSIGTAQDILQQYCSTIRRSQKVSSNEQYAQKTVSFEKKVGEMNDAIDEIANPDDEEEDNDDKKEE